MQFEHYAGYALAALLILALWFRRPNRIDNSGIYVGRDSHGNIIQSKNGAAEPERGPDRVAWAIGIIAALIAAAQLAFDVYSHQH